MVETDPRTQAASPVSAPANVAAEAAFTAANALIAERRVAEAQAMHLRAAEAGHPRAQVELARMLLYGIAGPAEPASAVQWLLRAEAGGNPVAGYLLALAALGGLALPRDQSINERLGLAIDAGLPSALLAAAIHFGRKPHPDDQALCIGFLERATSLGDRTAASLLAERLAAGEGMAAQPELAAGMRQQLSEQGLSPLPAVTAPPPWQPPCPPRQLAIEDALALAPARLLSTRPRVGVVDGLLSADECRLLIASTQPILRASRTVDPDTELPITLPLRTSSDASLDPVQEDFALRMVQLRICAAAGIDLPHAEYLTVLRYEPGQEYRPHRDYVPPGAIERDRPQAGNRARTICVYLNDVEAGGATEFPVPGVKVAPKAGTAVVFDNLRADGSPDPDTLHAGLPVERGVKWLATLWLRQGHYRDF
ncbi:hypothetical protein BH23PSE2_BH23PSE2_03380 [soil metagenome]